MTEKNAIAFPTLTDDELGCLRKLGETRVFADDEPLFENGDKEFSFFAITSGEVLVVEDSTGTEREVTVRGPGEFTGDVAMLTGRPAVVTLRAKGECETIEIPSAQVRRMMAEVPAISDKLLEAFQLRRQILEESDFKGVRVIGASKCKEATQLREFFYKNKVPYTFEDIDEEEGRRALDELGATSDETPIIACSQHVVQKPSLGKVAECLGISREIKGDLFDVVIVGAGPAGLAAAIYGASEGLQTLLVDRMGPGGQAGQSSKIENYMGFPAGLPGAELANRGFLQAMKFGALFTAPVAVRSLTTTAAGEHVLELCTGQKVHTKTVLIATGASYRSLPLEGRERLEGAGVFYSATSVEARLCRNATAVVVGGGNSAGQAAMFLATHARQVKLLIRGDDLRKSMSDYLANRIEKASNIQVLLHTELTGLRGDRSLDCLTVRDNRSGEEQEMDCPAVFLFVGAKPHTEWLPDSIALDDDGFVLTGSKALGSAAWLLEREPCELETTSPGVFAAGDVRSGTTKRCAFAAGDGALAITCVHQHLSRA